MINYLVLFIAICLSAVAAYYSVAGLIVLFSAAVIPVMIMGSCLEAAKVVGASWLYRNWDTCPKMIKYYLTSAIVVLIFITSMGIFGFLSKAHIDQNLGTSDNTVIIKNLEREIQSEESAIRNAQRSIDILDRLVSEADPKDANFIRNRQKREREALNNEIRASGDRIKTLNTELTPLRQESLRIEAEVGPLKYVADLIYGESDQRLLEKAVRWVIIILVFVFDPLAIVLLLAANHSLKNNQPRPRPPPNKVKKPKVVAPLWLKKANALRQKKKKGILEIDEKSIVRMK